MPDANSPVAPIVIKKYANRRLYDTESSIYITLDTLADMVRCGKEFVIYDARTGDDITRSVLTQIIMEEETKGRAMLPATFLRQLIRFYGDSMQGLVPDYLDQMMEQFAASQKQIRSTMERTMETFLPPEMEKIGRQNMAMMDRALSMFVSMYQPAPDAPAPGPAARPDAPSFADGNAHAAGDASPGAVKPETMEEELERLRREVAALRDALGPQGGRR
ncbi:polyhydroxyalkonate synthesis repressor, PhaR [Gluconacetobacter diazotrophicus PA1 5]|uniref:polyhydroxyalkanoate synthesis repressor PhaR n=1 Tax=Gluconacetobacter diazotrophicus TaxID=33996 RepID=UPI000173B2AC|nr:polyhydroxyalkanoate synthesis repressor PhaR [Gluconacetobacter diazotrophicus]ACI52797.1 polyhydroxyalkonate synthesis repressor, PhaR [Gluconacetobacter diazotrophicus PA1 5]TWB09058.1 polyhydroxyalkanoate synthesis repressor PhaR [Gluconacetobacter diazotrophicus]